MLGIIVFKLATDEEENSSVTVSFAQCFFDFDNLLLSVLLKTWYSNKIDNEKESAHQFL